MATIERTRRPGRVPRERRLLPGALVLLALFAVAATVRLWHIGTAYELFIDEVTYADLATSVARGDGVLLHGEPFHLHPAGFFATSGLVVRLLGLQDGNLADVAFALRPLPALIGALTPVLVAAAVHRVARSWWVAGAAGALLALDPFLIRFDSRVLLEAQAMALAAAGVLVLLVVLRREEHERPVRAWAVLAGVLLAASLLTKETYAFVTGLPVLVLLVTGLVLRRRTSALVLVSTVAVYLIYVVGVALAGQLPLWFDSKTRGVQRLLGIVQETGFNREGSPGFVDRLLANLAGLGVTYALIGLGVLANLYLLRLLLRHRPVPGVHRPGAVLLVVWSLGAYAHLAYALTLGTLEEQMFYLLVVTGVPVVCLAARVVRLQDVPALPAASRRAGSLVVPLVLAVALVGALVVEAGVWWRLRTVPDDGYARFLEWAETGLPEGSRLATTEEVAQFVMDDRLVVRLSTAEEVRDLGAEHVVLVSELIEQGYSEADDDLLALARSGRLVHATETRTLGRLEVWELPRPAE